MGDAAWKRVRRKPRSVQWYGGAIWSWSREVESIDCVSLRPDRAMTSNIDAGLTAKTMPIWQKFTRVSPEMDLEDSIQMESTRSAAITLSSEAIERPGLFPFSLKIRPRSPRAARASIYQGHIRLPGPHESASHLFVSCICTSAPHSFPLRHLPRSIRISRSATHVHACQTPPACRLRDGRRWCSRLQ